MKIICVGRNYAEHAKELGNAAPAEPVLFMKPDSAVLLPHNPFFIPDFSQNVHHEIELVVKINRVGKNIEERFAHKYYDEVTVGIDFTARDVQDQLKAKGLPWEKAKAFDGSAVVGKFRPITQWPKIETWQFELTKNGKTVQVGRVSDMIFSIDRIIAEISKYFTLKKGDLIYTGTPSGVEKITLNDRLVGRLNGEVLLEVDIR
jgi:2-keto-4-pentenoate hydratase/2-oxohepta-3-ene-1,7-dioic acid hydratase in catechol pathway